MDYKKDTNFDQNPHPLFAQDTHQIEKRKSFHQTLSQRTEKLATAVYLVTNHIDDREMIRNAYRDASLALVLDTAALEDPIQAPEELFRSIGVALQKLQSLTNLAMAVGILSEANGQILAHELLRIREYSRSGYSLYSLTTLDDVLKTMYPDEANTSIDANGHSGHVPLPSAAYQDKPLQETQNLKKELPSKTPETSFVNKREESKQKTVSPDSSRKNMILKLIRDRGEVSIKDISIDFTECSEKTIQRDINALVEEGKLEKSGDRRWSRYAIKE